MKIGMTYDLRTDYLAKGFSEEETAEFDSAETIDAIEKTLCDLSHTPVRIGNICQLTQRLADGERWDIVFNIAEGFKGFAREAQVPAILEAYDIPYTFSDPMILSLTLHKGLTKRVIRDLGIPTPPFFLVDETNGFLQTDLSFPLFAKPVSEGTGKGISRFSKVNTPKELTAVCDRLLRQFRQPVLVETFLPGRELTVGILGTGNEAKSIGVLEIIFKENAEAEIYSFHNKEHYKEVVEYRLADDHAAQRTSEIALAAWQGLGCRDAGRIDLRLDADGVPNFMEVNPLAGLHPVNSDLCIIASLTGMAYTTLIDSILTSALRRYSPDEGKRLA